jgi:hypothetical protein
MRPPPEIISVHWFKQARHSSQMDRLRICEVKSVCTVAAPARPSGRDGVMASTSPTRRRWLLEGAGAAFQHVLTASSAPRTTVTYDQAEHCPILYARERASARGLIVRLLGVALEAVNTYGVWLLRI